MAQQPADARIIADSDKDFSGTQGDGGWTYLYFISNKDGTDAYMPDDARRMWWVPPKAGNTAAWLGRTSVWTGPERWYQNMKRGFQPQVINGCFQGWAVRRWTSDRAATIHIAGHASRDSKDGDGVDIKVFLEGKELFSKLLAPASSTDIDLTTPITKGARLDFVVTPGPTLDATFDATSFHVAILLSDGTQ